MQPVVDPSGRTPPAARLEGVTKYYGSVRAVTNVSFKVEPGELLTLLGPSGCGKTTIMRSIAGLEKISSGEIFLNDKVMSSVSRGIHVTPEKRDVGMVFQSYAIWPHMTVFENVAYPLRCRKVEKGKLRRRVIDGLSLVDMEEYAERPATQLSGGQQQRVALARSIVMEPSMLLLDEPLSNLDAKLRGQMRAHIKDLQRRTGLTMVYVTHDQAEAMALSDRIIVMAGGVIEQVGSPEEVYERPQSKFVADFVGAINFVEGRVACSGQGICRVATGGGEICFKTLSGPAPDSGTPVLMMVRPENVRICENRGPAQGPDAAILNRLSARIATNTYCGDHREVTAKAGTVDFFVSAANTVSVEPGCAVWLEFSSDDVHVLPPSRARDGNFSVAGGP